MTNFFQARFPQHSVSTQNPTPQDYLDAAHWHYKREKRVCNFDHHCMPKTTAFARTYRRFGWIPKQHDVEPIAKPERA